MARRHRQEEHINHEAWAIPYGDLVTLLLAFFVVMYAISSVNESKFRVMSDALNSAFGGPPRTISPIQLGQAQLRGSAFDRPSPLAAGAKAAPAAFTPVKAVHVRQVLELPTFGRAGFARLKAESAREADARRERQLNSLGRQIQRALGEMMRLKLVTVRRGSTYLEVEIQSDILFASGVATPSPVALATVRKLAAVLRDEANAVRVEGYTDDQPIRTAQFPSNWELSAARAASVVHVLTGEGVDASRLAVVGYGEHQPIADNGTQAGRNANRRVLLVILAAPQAPDAIPDAGPTVAFEPGDDAHDDEYAVVAPAVAAAVHAAVAADTGESTAATTGTSRAGAVDRTRATPAPSPPRARASSSSSTARSSTARSSTARSSTAPRAPVIAPSRTSGSRIADREADRPALPTPDGVSAGMQDMPRPGAG